MQEGRAYEATATITAAAAAAVAAAAAAATADQKDHHEVLVIGVLHKGEQAVVLPVLPEHHVEVHTVWHPSLPAYMLM